MAVNATETTRMLKQVQAVEINILGDVFGHVHTEQQRIMRHNFILDP